LAVLSWHFRKYPKLVEAFKNRAKNYNASVAFMHHPPAGVRIREIAPPLKLAVGRTTKNEPPLRAAYETGIRHGEMFMKKWDDPLNS
ncbi:MAG TPA: DUF6363 domain-containing protein, partial [Smithellaceae bacterium]|nr:DUF6363 domain-containing protein [Smithellaceae bacterium]